MPIDRERRSKYVRSQSNEVSLNSRGKDPNTETSERGGYEQGQGRRQQPGYRAKKEGPDPLRKCKNNQSRRNEQNRMACNSSS